MSLKEVYIVAASRTPIGSFNGVFSSLSASKLGAIAIKSVVEKAGIQPGLVQEVYMGNVLSAGMGQAPARQAALFAGLSNQTKCTTINKVCASGTKATMIGAQSIMLGDADVVITGGMESMSNVPYYLDKARRGYQYGNSTLIDGVLNDGLWDVYNNYHMGNAGEKCATDYNISREAQDEYAINSYKRAAAAWEAGKYTNEVAPVVIEDRKGPITVSVDEEYTKVNFEKIPSLRPVFTKDGTITAANASTLNDGASAVLLMSGEKVKELGLKPLAKIISFADAEQEPANFTTSPRLAIELAVKKANLTLADIDFFEINEAFSVVCIANNQLLGLDPKKVNIYGGAVAIGHPLGSSGSRILVTLTSVLHQENGKYGVVGICNGGGGASAIVIERV